MATTSHARSTPPQRGAAARRGTFPTESPARYGRPVPLDLADEDPPGSPEPWHVAAPVRPDTAHVRARRFLDALGDLLAAVVLVAGGAVLVAVATLA